VTILNHLGVWSGVYTRIGASGIAYTQRKGALGAAIPLLQFEHAASLDMQVQPIRKFAAGAGKKESTLASQLMESSPGALGLHCAVGASPIETIEVYPQAYSVKLPGCHGVVLQPTPRVRFDNLGQEKWHDAHLVDAFDVHLVLVRTDTAVKSVHVVILPHLDPRILLQGVSLVKSGVPGLHLFGILAMPRGLLASIRTNFMSEGYKMMSGLVPNQADAKEEAAQAILQLLGVEYDEDGALQPIAVGDATADDPAIGNGAPVAVAAAHHAAPAPAPAAESVGLLLGDVSSGDERLQAEASSTQALHGKRRRCK
jgi:hypothetical protein